MPLGDYLEQWLATVKTRVRPSTYEMYEVMVMVHLTPALGHVRLGKLTPEDIEKAYAAMQTAGKSASVIEHALLRLAKALNDAVRRQHIYRNPCHAGSPPHPFRRELAPIESRGIQRLLAAAHETDYYALCTPPYTRASDATNSWPSYQEPKTAKARWLVALTPSSVGVLRGLWTTGGRGAAAGL